MFNNFHLKGWRTIAINVLSFAGMIFASDEIYKFISPERAVEALAIVNVLMRFISTTPVGVSAPLLVASAPTKEPQS